METNPEIADEEWANAQAWRGVDDTIVLMGLLLFQATLFKSGYTAEVMAELMERVGKLIKYYSKKGM